MINEGENISAKCAICEDEEDLIDTSQKAFRLIRQKLQDFTDSKDDYKRWFRFICSSCRTLLNDAWEFKILCKSAYRKFLESVAETPVSCALSVLSVNDLGADSLANENDAELEESACKIEFGAEELHYENIEMILQSEAVIYTGGQDEEILETRGQISCEEGESEEPGRTLRPRRPREKIPEKMNFGKKKTGSQSKVLQREEQGDRSVLRAKRRYICSFCHKTFSHSSSMFRHERIHTEDKSFVCAICLKAFRQKSNLKTHIETHKTKKNRKAYKCNYCNKNYTRKYALKIHTRKHTGGKPYCCQNCSQKFCTYDKWKHHINNKCSFQSGSSGSSKD